jgi:Tol biopolymer transport system component
MAVHLVAPESEAREILPHVRAWNRDPRWSLEGRMLAYTSDDGMGLERELRVFDRETGLEEAWGGALDRVVGGFHLRGWLQCAWLPSAQLLLGLDPEQKLEVEGLDRNALYAEGRLNEEAIRRRELPMALLAIGVVGPPGRWSTEPFLVTRTQVLPLLLPIRTLMRHAGDSRRFVEWNIAPNAKGDRIAFESNDGGDREIFVLSRTGIADVSNHAAADWNPAWGRSGRMLLFQSFRSGRSGIYEAITDTAHVLPVAVPENCDAWSPAWNDGETWLAYVSDCSGTSEVYVVRKAGAEPVQVSRSADTGGFAEAPAWRPRQEAK